MMKLEVMAAWTSGRRNSSAVPVFRVRSVGASIVGRGEGRDVRCGFWLRAAFIAEDDSGGDISVMP